MNWAPLASTIVPCNFRDFLSNVLGRQGKKFVSITILDWEAHVMAGREDQHS